MEKTILSVSPINFTDALRLLHACGTDAAELRFTSGEYLLNEPVTLTEAHPQNIAFVGEGDVRIAAGERIAPVWERHTDTIWKACIGAGRSFDTLRADGVRQILCRYPDYRDGAVLNGSSPDALSPERIACWKNPAGGFIRALHSAHWGGNSYRITGKTPSGELTYEWVGNNNRGSGMNAEAVMVENIFEELDSEHEWYYDRTEGILYYCPADGADPSGMTFEISGTEELFRLTGAKNITFENLTFSGTSRTMFTVPHERPLRGDWAIQRTGAIFAENAEHITIRGCHFTDLGGNAVMFSGYHRDSLIEDCEFDGIGASGVLLCGNASAARDPSEWDGDHHKTTISDYTPGPANDEYVKDVVVQNCYFTDCGTLEKQSAGVCISIAEHVTVRGNTVHRMPRAGVNISDGTFGGHFIEDNDIFDCVRETGDHGPFNSWGRDRFWSLDYFDTMGKNGVRKRAFARLDALHTTVIRHNRIHALHAFGIDLDDGSTNYEIYNNLCLGAGIKTREGFDRLVYNNILIGCPFEVHVSYALNSDVFANNLVVNSKPFNSVCLNEGNTTAIVNNFYWNGGAPVTGIPEQDRDSAVCDPMFAFPSTNDYTVGEGSEILAKGFVNFPMSDADFGRADKPNPPPFVYIAAGTDMHTLEYGGILLADITGDGMQSAAGLPDRCGAMILRVPFDSRFSAYGFRMSDVIRSVDGRTVENAADTARIFDELAAGREVCAEVYRNQRPEQIVFTK